MFRCLNENHENGRYHYNEEEDISAFEDLQPFHAAPVFYAWRGDWEAHDTARLSPDCESLESAARWVREQE